MLKFTNKQKTAARFNDTFFNLDAPEDWDSIGCGPIRDKVKAWLAAGNTPEPADPEPVVVPVVTMRQARLALLAAGKLDTVTAAVRQVGGAAQIEWEYATEVRRDWPLVNALADAVGITGDELDALFAQAAKL